MKKILLLIEQVFTAIALMLYSGGPLNVILSGGVSQGEQAVAEPDFSLTRYCFLLTYAIFSLLLALRWKKVLYRLRQDRTILPLISLTLLSVVWSDAPNLTLSNGIGLVGATLFGIYLATRYTRKQQLQILGWGFALVVTLSLIYALALPKYGIMGGVHAGAWRGIYTHKNTLGKIATLSSVIFLMLTLRDRRYRWFSGIGLALSMALILLSASKGALINVFTLFTVAAICQIFRAQYQLLVLLLGGLVIASGVISTWLATHLETIVVDILGKDLTFTGRTTLWSTVLDVGQERMWLGHGYYGFWNGWDSAAAKVWYQEAWLAPDAHNGFIDLWIQLGLIGLALFGIGYLINALTALSQLRRTTGVEFIWPVLYLIYVILSNIAESSLLSNNIFWVLYVMIALTLLTPVDERSPSSRRLESAFIEERFDPVYTQPLQSND